MNKLVSNKSILVLMQEFSADDLNNPDRFPEIFNRMMELEQRGRSTHKLIGGEDAKKTQNIFM